MVSEADISPPSLDFLMMMMLLLLPVIFPLSPGALAGEITGGHEVIPHCRPYMAFVKMETGGGRATSRCGGFLIRQDVVVTAAHCNVGNITVLLGAHNIAIKEPRKQEIQIRRRIPHPKYNDETNENDIMLLQLECLAKLNDWVKPIKLPKAKQRVRSGTQCSVAGWGLTSSKPEKKANVLMELELLVKEDKFCTKYYDKDYKSKTMLCAEGMGVHKRTLQGDSGGPLVCGDVVQGICSWDVPKFPAEVYTRVSHFVPWIQREMKKLP